MSLLELTGAGVRFGGIRAVSGVDMGIERDSLTALIGPNGAGKTTIFNLITGIYEPTEGAIGFDGRPLRGLLPAARARLGIARTFQNIRLFRELSVLDNVRAAYVPVLGYGPLGSVLRGPSFRSEEREFEARARAVLEETGLLDAAGAPAGSLPYGAQRRLELARALATSPKLLLLDEPAAGMNPSEKAALAKLIRSLKERHRLTVLLIEHDMKFVMGLSEKIFVMDHGVKIAEGTPEMVRTNPKVIEAYLGPDLTVSEVFAAEREAGTPSGGGASA